MVEEKFLEENQYLVVYIPDLEGLYPFRVRAILNKGCEVYEYGPLPVELEFGKVGKIPPNTVTGSFTWIARRDPSSSISVDGVAQRKDDIFFIPESQRNRLIHAWIDVQPRILRCYREIPKGQKPYRYLDIGVADAGRTGAVIGAVDYSSSFGYVREYPVEQIFIPEVMIGWVFANRTNLPVWTHSTIQYREYLVEIPRDSYLIFDLMTRKVKSYWFTYMAIATTAFKATLEKVYGVLPIKLYGAHERDKAIPEIDRWLSGVKV